MASQHVCSSRGGGLSQRWGPCATAPHTVPVACVLRPLAGRCCPAAAPSAARPQVPPAAAMRGGGGWDESDSTPTAKRVSTRPEDANVAEPHKVFDEVVITVKSGRGGNGEIVPSGRGRMVPNHKYTPGGNSPKTIWLPSSEPGDGADGGDVVLVCDPGVDSLLHLHARNTYAAPGGSNANPNTGSAGPKRNRDIKKARTAPLEIPVPPGTVVKRKGTGALVGELLQPGQRLTVAYGGTGGHGVVAPSKEQNKARMSRAERMARTKGVELVAVEDEGWKQDCKGQPGQQLSLQLLLRVVADAGLVGFPNAGKSSLLKSLTRASPAVAPYPFTTLMPNLGVLSAGGGASQAVLADLPGLIEGAHKGRGLGRNFLRHLRRTRALLHVVDASAPDPATDYYAVREELRMYNPDYCARPHVVALNKLDLLLPPTHGSHADGADGEPAASGSGRGGEADAEREASRKQAVEPLVRAIQEAAQRQAAEHREHGYDGPRPRPPVAVVACSAATGEGLRELSAALQSAFGARRTSEPDNLRVVPDTLAASRGPAAAGVAAAAAAGAAAVVVDAPSVTSTGQGVGEPQQVMSQDFMGSLRELRVSEPDDDDGDDEWVDLSALDPETLQLVLAELEAGGEGDEGERLLGPEDVMLRGEGEQEGGEEATQEAAQQQHSVAEAAVEAAASSSSKGGSRRSGRGAAGDRVAAADAAARAPPKAGWGDEEEEGDEALVKMGSPDDPDAQLVGLSLEQLLAMEKD